MQSVQITVMTCSSQPVGVERFPIQPFALPKNGVPPKVTVSLFSCSSSLIPKISLVDFLLQKTLKSKKESFFKD
jgi:hypothetical protein